MYCDDICNASSARTCVDGALNTYWLIDWLNASRGWSQILKKLSFLRKNWEKMNWYPRHVGNLWPIYTAVWTDGRRLGTLFQLSQRALDLCRVYEQTCTNTSQNHISSRHQCITVYQEFLSMSKPIHPGIHCHGVFHTLNPSRISGASFFKRLTLL